MGDKMDCARAALRAACFAGVRVRVMNGFLELEAPAEPPAAVVDRLAQYKTEIIAMSNGLVCHGYYH